MKGVHLIDGRYRARATVDGERRTRWFYTEVAAVGWRSHYSPEYKYICKGVSQCRERFKAYAYRNREKIEEWFSNEVDARAWRREQERITQKRPKYSRQRRTPYSEGLPDDVYLAVTRRLKVSGEEIETLALRCKVTVSDQTKWLQRSFTSLADRDPALHDLLSTRDAYEKDGRLPGYRQNSWDLPEGLSDILASHKYADGTRCRAIRAQIRRDGILLKSFDRAYGQKRTREQAAKEVAQLRDEFLASLDVPEPDQIQSGKTAGGTYSPGTGQIQKGMSSVEGSAVTV